jgi:hypothetical protein
MSEPLEALVGEWSLEARFPGAPPSDARGRLVFEWMAGERFLVERWEVPVPEAPDGLAIIGFDEGRRTFLQHYFDSRGVARVYGMSLEGGEWKLWRDEPDFSPLNFRQRFSGTFSDDGQTIAGAWERTEGEDFVHDFDLVYTRIG